MLTILTAKIETLFDGDDTYGFPLTFFNSLGGKRFPNQTNWSKVFYFNLLIDFIVALIIAIAIRALYVILKKNWRQQKSGT